MRMTFQPVPFTWMVALALALGTVPGDASAQTLDRRSVFERPVFVGYTVNAPHMFLGGSVGVLLGNWGIIADMKFAHEDRGRDPYFIKSIDPAQAEAVYGDYHVDTSDAWRAYNLSLVRVINTDFAVYAGAGYAERTTYREYQDPLGNRGRIGYYWVEDAAASGSTVNLQVGGLFAFGRSLVFQFGFETQPRGGTIGVMLPIPFLGS